MWRGGSVGARVSTSTAACSGGSSLLGSMASCPWPAGGSGWGLVSSVCVPESRVMTPPSCLVAASCVTRATTAAASPCWGAASSADTVCCSSAALGSPDIAGEGGECGLWNRYNDGRLEFVESLISHSAVSTRPLRPAWCRPLHWRLGPTAHCATPHY